jgi:hypothetical protein
MQPPPAPIAGLSLPFLLAVSSWCFPSFVFCNTTTQYIYLIYSSPSVQHTSALLLGGLVASGAQAGKPQNGLVSNQFQWFDFPNWC